MYTEVYQAVANVFAPVNELYAKLAYNKSNFDRCLASMLKLFYEYTPFLDISRYKKILIQDLSNPNRQSVIIVFDYSDIEEDNRYKPAETILKGKFIYKGKLTAITIIPLSIQKNLNKAEYLANEMFQIVAHIMDTDRFGYDMAKVNADHTYVPFYNVNLYAIDLIYTKWMMDTFLGVTLTYNEFVDIVLKQFLKSGTLYQEKHIKAYIELLEDTDISYLLDYSFVAGFYDMLAEIYNIESDKDGDNDGEVISEDKTE